MQKYKEARKNIKKVMSEERGQAYTELYQKINTKEGENDISMISLIDFLCRTKRSRTNGDNVKP
jgi:hypothetical protein